MPRARNCGTMDRSFIWMLYARILLLVCVCRMLLGGKGRGREGGYESQLILVGHIASETPTALDAAGGDKRYLS